MIFTFTLRTRVLLQASTFVEVLEYSHNCQKGPSTRTREYIVLILDTALTTSETTAMKILLWYYVHFKWVELFVQWGLSVILKPYVSFFALSFVL